jgi:isoprenylcysteine carboxyl methyltransferase (ICMT) family protein YpbQ
MSAGIVVFTVYAIILRGLSFAISIRNERRLRPAGAVEYGKGGTVLLTAVSLVYAASAITEGAVRRAQLDGVAVAGIVIHALSMMALFYVIYELRDVWTMKILIAREHRLVTSWLFRTVKHPNYFLNLIPEFVGLTLVFKAWITALILFPFLLGAIGIRITQEERAMHRAFGGYRGILPGRT